MIGANNFLIFKFHLNHKFLSIESDSSGIIDKHTYLSFRLKDVKTVEEGTPTELEFYGEAKTKIIDALTVNWTAGDTTGRGKSKDRPVIMTVCSVHDYIGVVEYHDGVQEACQIEEGRINLQTGKHEYSIRDHLGNPRVYFAVNDANTADVLQEAHYYPFGLPIHNLSYSNELPTNNYQYNGKELNPDFGLHWNDYGARWYDAQIGKWLAVDPLAAEMPEWSTYVAMADNPIRYIDPDGRKFVDFDENGNYQGVKKDNWWHNLWHGTKGRVLDSNGKATQGFKFADPKSDVAALESGEITKLIFVQEQDVYDMLHDAGAFSETNRDKPADFLSQEGIGMGKFDFSYTAIPGKYSDASTNPLTSPSPVLFLAGNMAHNHMNFGNFLFGAGGGTLGVHLGALRLGAHKNSRYPEDANGNRIPQGSQNPNGYAPEWDSRDDQRSIKAGYDYARKRGYHRMSITVDGGVKKIPWYYRF